jgi:pre-mRNA-processing factor 19
LRKELSHALYQHDAACRVIARLMKEKEDLKNNVSSKMEEEEEMQESSDSPFDKKIMESIQNVATKLSSKRKKRELSDTLATPEFVKKYQLEGSFPLHKTKPAGITCMDIHPSKNMVKEQQPFLLFRF